MKQILVWCICICSVMFLLHCSNNNSQSSKVKLTFDMLKDEGIACMEKDELTKAIDLFEQAIQEKQDEEIQRYLAECYFERGEYYYSVGKTTESENDLKKSNTNKANNLLMTLYGKQGVLLISPESSFIVKSYNMAISWQAVPMADKYIVQIQDDKWNVVVSEFTNKQNWKNDNILKGFQVYYWSIRAHFPNDTWGKWSEKRWFSIQTAEEIANRKTEDLKNIIRISKVYPSSPNFAGGVDLHIVWQNRSTKVIKYAWFITEPYNAVGDVVDCTISNDSKFTGKVTGPLKSGEWEGEDTYWECAWYNNTIVKVKLLEIRIEYMDNSNLTIEENDIQKVIF